MSQICESNFLLFGLKGDYSDCVLRCAEIAVILKPIKYDRTGKAGGCDAVTGLSSAE
jgi:hypothetical protein